MVGTKAHDLTAENKKQEKPAEVELTRVTPASSIVELDDNEPPVEDALVSTIKMKKERGKVIYFLFCLGIVMIWMGLLIRATPILDQSLSKSLIQMKTMISSLSSALLPLSFTDAANVEKAI